MHLYTYLRTVTTMTENELFGISEQLDDMISRQAAIDAVWW